MGNHCASDSPKEDLPPKNQLNGKKKLFLIQKVQIDSSYDLMSYKKKSKTDNFKILLLGDSGVGNLYLKLTFPGKSCTLIQLIVFNKKKLKI
jgi:hypothetical protein